MLKSWRAIPEVESLSVVGDQQSSGKMKDLVQDHTDQLFGGTARVARNEQIGLMPREVW